MTMKALKASQLKQNDMAKSEEIEIGIRNAVRFQQVVEVRE
jgi:hypothetical protein